MEKIRAVKSTSFKGIKFSLCAKHLGYAEREVVPKGVVYYFSLLLRFLTVLVLRTYLIRNCI